MTLGAPPLAGGPAPSPATTAADAPDALAPAGARRSRTPWRVAIRLARRDVRRAPGRTAIVAGMLALPLAVVTLLLVTYAMQVVPTDPTSYFADGVVAEVSHLGTPVLQAGPSVQDFWSEAEPAENLTWDGTTKALAAVLPGATGWATDACATGYRAGGGGRWANVCTYRPVGAGTGAAAGVVSGRAPAGPHEALGAAGSTDTVGTTAEVVVDGTTLTLAVVGTFAADQLGNAALLVGADPAAAPAGELGNIQLTAPAVTWADTVRLNEAGFLVWSRAAYLENPPREAIPFFTEGHTLTSTSPTGGSDLALVGLGLVALLLVLVLVVTPTQVVGVRRAARSHALLAATGADARTLRRIVLVGAGVQGFVAAVCGVGLGLLVAVVIQTVAPNALSGGPASLVVPWLWLAGIVVLTVLLVLAAALVPARSASRIDVVRVLAGRRGDAPPSRRTPIVGVLLGAGGLAVGTWAVLNISAVGVAAALVAVVVGLLLCSGGLVDLAGRVLAPRASLPVRLALRDAVRHRSRSVAAVTAVTAAAAALVAASALVASDDAHHQATMMYGAGHGTVVTYVYPDVVDGRPALDAAEAAVRAADPAATFVRVLAPATTRPGLPTATPLTWPDGELALEPDTTKLCPSDVAATEITPEQAVRLAETDPRCAPEILSTWGTGWNASVFVDDGTWTAASGLPDAAAAAAALRAGRAVVAADTLVHSDGTATVVLEVPDAEDLEGTTVTTPSHLTPGRVTVPATHVPALGRTAFGAIVPPSVVAELGLEIAPIGAITTPSSPDRAAVVEAAATVSGTSSNVENHRGSASPVLAAILLAAAFVLGIGTAGLVLLLVAGEVRPDLAVLAAVGAAPRARRRILAAQAGTLVAIGTALGTAVGLVVTAGYVALSARRSGVLVDPTWTFEVPWAQAVGIIVLLPVGAWLTGWLTTRSRLPLPSEVR